MAIGSVAVILFSRKCNKEFPINAFQIKVLSISALLSSMKFCLYEKVRQIY